VNKEKKEKTGKSLPNLPTGITVGERPENIELMVRAGSGKWISTIEHLVAIHGTTDSVRIPLKGLEKNAINTIKVGIRSTANKMGFKEDIRFGIQEDILYVWSNPA